MKEIAEIHDKSEAQVYLKWLYEQRVIVVPW